MKRYGFLSKFWILAIVLLTVGCDQVTKELTRQKVEPKEYIPVIGDHLILTNVENTGAMLGFGQDFPPMAKRIFFQGLPLIVLVILLYRTLTQPNLNQVLLLAFGLVIGGGIGNLVDRIAHGSVTDFFQIRLGFLRTGIFNVADIAVTLGVLILVFLIIRGRKLSF